MNRQEFDEIRSMVERANENLEEIRNTRKTMQSNLRQLDLNEAGWLGALEALSPFYNRGIEQFETASEVETPEAENSAM